MSHLSFVRIASLLLAPVVSLRVFPIPGAAQEPGMPYPLGEIVVSAAQPVSEATGTLRRVSAEDIEAYGARTLDEAIALLPGVHVRLGSDGVPRVDLRGFRTRQVTLLLDGVPLNATADGQFDPTLVPVEQIAEIKLSSGGGSVLYGSGGLAGVINVITRQGDRRAVGSLRGEWREGDAWLGRATAGGGAGPVRVFGSASRTSVDAVPSRDGSPTLGDPAEAPRLASDRERLAGFGRVDVALGTSGSAAFTVEAADGEAGVPPSVIDDPADPFANRAVYERVEDVDALALQASAGGSLGDGWSIRGWAFRNLLDLLSQRYADEQFDPASVLAANGTARGDSRSVLSGGAVQIATSALPAGRATLALSARRSTWRQELVEAVAVTAPGGGGGSGGGGGGGGAGGGGAATLQLRSEGVDRALWEYGVALEYELRPLPRVGVAAGGMYHRLDASGLDDDALGASLGAYVDLDPRVRLRATYARRFRFPTLRQLYDATAANPALDTEQADLYEAGVEYALVPEATISMTGYRSDARNFIERPQGAPQFENAERYRLQGIEVEAVVRPLNTVLTRGRYTYLDGEDRTPGREGSPLQYRPRHLLSTELRYTTPWGLEASGSLHYVSGQVYETRRAPLLQADLPEYALLALRLRQPFGQVPLAVVAGADNLLDHAYEQSYGFPQAGRIIYLGVDLGRPR